MVARYDPQKDHKNLLCALELLLKKNPDFICILVGQGINTDNHELVDLINLHNLSNKVILLGPRSDIPSIMSMLDIHVLSSLGEAFPNVLAEALGCATPCVTTDVGDASYIVGDTGWVVPAGNSRKLGNAIKEALEELKNSKTWRQRQQRARDRVIQNFDLDNMISGYSRVWHE
jgi:glycosyltransferase involved in cell wall biosynthesis